MVVVVVVVMVVHVGGGGGGGSRGGGGGGGVVFFFSFSLFVSAVSAAVPALIYPTSCGIQEIGDATGMTHL